MDNLLTSHKISTVTPSNRKGELDGGAKIGPMAMPLSDERLRREMGELTSDLVSLYEAKYPRFYNAMTTLEKDALIELMIELCDVFDLHSNLTAEIARRYKEHRLESGSLEDRDWPEN